jgi:hypothetical protein
MVTLLFLSLFLVTLYVGVTTWKLGELPDSISSMVYVLPEGGWRWLWTVWLWAVALLTCIPAIEALRPKSLEVFGFFTMACLVFTGAMPLFLKDQERTHHILAIAGGIFSQIVVLFVSPWFLALWLLMVWLLLDSLTASETPRWYDGKSVFISEAICYASFFGSLIFNF